MSKLLHFYSFDSLSSSSFHLFSHNPNSKKSARIMAIPNVGLCQRCHDIIEWRKKFRKYKPIKNFTKCQCCGEKKVRSAYHNWCTDCAKATNVCPKCLLNRDIVAEAAAELTQEAIQEMLVQVGMKERVRRKIWRLWENNKVTDQELKEMIFSYNPDSKEEVDDGDGEEKGTGATAPSPAALAAARGPPPKPKPSAPKPQAQTLTPATSSTHSTTPPTATSASAPPAKQQQPDDEDDEDDEDGEFDFEDDDEDEDEPAAEEPEKESKSESAPTASSSAAPVETTVPASSSSAPSDDGEWETQTTRKQRKKQAKTESATSSAAAAASSSSSNTHAADDDDDDDDDSIPCDPTLVDDESAGMASEFMAEGLVGLDGKVIPPGAPTFIPPPQPATAPMRKPRYAFDENQLPKCFVCQTRHDMGECRKKDRL